MPPFFNPEKKSGRVLRNAGTFLSNCMTSR